MGVLIRADCAVFLNVGNFSRPQKHKHQRHGRWLCQKKENAILRDNDSCWFVITNHLIGRKDNKTIYYKRLYYGFKWKIII